MHRHRKFKTHLKISTCTAVFHVAEQKTLAPLFSPDRKNRCIFSDSSALRRTKSEQVTLRVGRARRLRSPAHVSRESETDDRPPFPHTHELERDKYTRSVCSVQGAYASGAPTWPGPRARGKETAAAVGRDFFGRFLPGVLFAFGRCMVVCRSVRGRFVAAAVCACALFRTDGGKVRDGLFEIERDVYAIVVGVASAVLWMVEFRVFEVLFLNFRNRCFRSDLFFSLLCLILIFLLLMIWLMQYARSCLVVLIILYKNLIN